jgi:hypothetical protein
MPLVFLEIIVKHFDILQVLLSATLISLQHINFKKLNQQKLYQ